MQRVLKLIAQMPRWARKPIMSGAMQAMQNPPEALRRLALAALPVNVLLLFLPHLYKVSLLTTEGRYGLTANISPHSELQRKVEGDSPRALLVGRCARAHRNSLETFPMFAAALLAAIGRMVDRADRSKVNRMRGPIAAATLAAKFTAARFAYIFVYMVGGSNKWLGVLRTGLYAQNIAVIVQLFVLAIKAPM